jgi:hypothetical protein
VQGLSYPFEASNNVIPNCFEHLNDVIPNQREHTDVIPNPGLPG